MASAASQALRVAHVLPSLALRAGGPAVYVAELVAATKRAGVDSRIYTTDLPGPPARRRQTPVAESAFPIAADGADVFVAPVRWPYRFAYAPVMRSVLRREVEFEDLLHIHSLFLYPQYAAWDAARRNGTPYIVSLHGALDPYLRRRGRARKWATDRVWQQKMLDGAAAIHCTTSEEAKLVADVAPGVQRVILPIGIELSQFGNLAGGDEFRHRYLAGRRDPVVLAIGRLARKKGLDVLVSAFAEVRQRHRAMLVLAGPDDEGIGAGLQRLASDLGIEDSVVFTGMLTQAERQSALAAADVWALPSRTENFAIAVLEALASGLPTVVSDAVNLAPELHAHSAALVRPPTAAAFADAILQLLVDSDSRSRLVRAGREFAETYDWRIVGHQTIDAYSAIVSRAGSPLSHEAA